jgi:hypothetical protein
MRRLAVVIFNLILALGIFHSVGLARASDQFSAQTIDFSGFSGRITIERHSGKEVTVSLKRGDARALQMSVEQDVLFIVYKRKPANDTGGTIVGTVSQFNIGENATQKIVIGNREFSAVKPQEMPELLIQAPMNVALVSAGFVGEAYIDAMTGPADLSVRDGRIRAKRLGPARLGIKGAGDIELEEATREVRMHIDGAGDITIKGGDVENAWADAKGAGSIKYTGGRIKHAFVTARGASTITLDGVDQVRKGPIEGASEVKINWLSR